MSRRLLILVLVAGVTSIGVPAETADAAPKKKSAKAMRLAKAKEAKARIPTKRTKPNMPRGFSWPPSKTMVAQADACEAKLDELGVEYTAAKPTGRVVRPMTIPSGQIGGITYTAVYSKHQVFDCQLVLTLANFAPRLYELGVREVKFGSAFRWTKVRVSGKTKNMMSRHALGIALDVVAFVDDTGREATVEKDYKRRDELLLGIERATNDSGSFRLLLTPRNDPKSHHDHFHFEANPDYSEAIEERPRS